MLKSANNVTRENYEHKAKAYMKANQRGEDLLGFMLDRVEHPHQWKAWLNYFERKNIRCAFMKRGGKECVEHMTEGVKNTGKYMVPAEWPTLFDTQI